MSGRYSPLTLCKAIFLVVACGVSTNACTTTFSWEEEVLLHDGKKIIVERKDTYDYRMNHEIGQGPPLAEHKTTFKVPDTNQKVVWKSNNRPSPDPDSLYLLVLDFLDGVPYVATSAATCVAYDKWNRPNPPYIFFKYVDGWQHISLQEFPEKFKINVIVTGRKKDNPKISEADRKFGFVPAETVAAINKGPGRSKYSYTLFREPVDLFMMCPEPTGPDGLPVKKGYKAPYPFKPGAKE